MDIMSNQFLSAAGLSSIKKTGNYHNKTCPTNQLPESLVKNAEKQTLNIFPEDYRAAPY